MSYRLAEPDTYKAIQYINDAETAAWLESFGVKAYKVANMPPDWLIQYHDTPLGIAGIFYDDEVQIVSTDWSGTAKFGDWIVKDRRHNEAKPSFFCLPDAVFRTMFTSDDRPIDACCS